MKKTKPRNRLQEGIFHNNLATFSLSRAYVLTWDKIAAYGSSSSASNSSKVRTSASNKYPDLNKIKKAYETHKNKFTLSYGSDIDEMIPYMIQSYM